MSTFEPAPDTITFESTDESFEIDAETLEHALRWEQQATENVEKWGLQDLESLLLATQEELGELTQAVLEANHEDGDPERIQGELDDLAALMYQLQRSLNQGDA